MAESNKSVKTNMPEETEGEALEKEAKRKKARLRTRGPYRKSHVDW